MRVSEFLLPPEAEGSGEKIGAFKMGFTEYGEARRRSLGCLSCGPKDREFSAFIRLSRCDVIYPCFDFLSTINSYFRPIYPNTNQTMAKYCVCFGRFVPFRLALLCYGVVYASRNGEQEAAVPSSLFSLDRY